MDYDRIIGLLDKYWKCETTLPEEEELRYFYKHCRQMPEELAEYRELFIFQEGERQIGLGNDFDRKILASIYNKRPAGWRKGLRVAAGLLAVAVSHRETMAAMPTWADLLPFMTFRSF